MSVTVNFFSEEFCIRVTSGPDPDLCKLTYPLDYQKYAGDEIKLKHNGEHIATLGRGFTNFSKCVTGKGVHRPWTDQVDGLIHRIDRSGLT